MVKCSAKNSIGEPCGAPPLKGSSYCSLHDPTYAKQFDKIRRAPKLVQKQPININEVVPKITNGKDIIKFLNVIIEQVHAGKIKTTTATCLNSLSKTLMTAMQSFGEEQKDVLPADLEEITTTKIKELMKGNLSELVTVQQKPS